MYSPVRDFVLKIEEAMQLQPELVTPIFNEHVSQSLVPPSLSYSCSTHCDLYQFLQDFVENRFLDTIQIEFQEKMDNALKRKLTLIIIDIQ